jgi:Transcription factor TFIIH complex subunit Tfb5
VQCDPSIKSIIVKIDSEKNDFIVEELDDQTLVIKEGMLQILKMRLNEVDSIFYIPRYSISKPDFRISNDCFLLCPFQAHVYTIREVGFENAKLRLFDRAVSRARYGVVCQLT